MPMSKRPWVSTERLCASHAAAAGWRSGLASTNVPTRSGRHRGRDRQRGERREQLQRRRHEQRWSGQIGMRLTSATATPRGPLRRGDDPEPERSGQRMPSLLRSTRDDPVGLAEAFVLLGRGDAQRGEVLVEAAGRADDQQPGRPVDAVERVRDGAREEDERAGRRREAVAAALDRQAPVEQVEALVLVEVGVPRRPAVDGGLDQRQASAGRSDGRPSPRRRGRAARPRARSRNRGSCAPPRDQRASDHRVAGGQGRRARRERGEGGRTQPASGNCRSACPSRIASATPTDADAVPTTASCRRGRGPCGGQQAAPEQHQAVHADGVRQDQVAARGLRPQQQVLGSERRRRRSKVAARAAGPTRSGPGRPRCC